MNKQLKFRGSLVDLLKFGNGYGYGSGYGYGCGDGYGSNEIGSNGLEVL